MGGCIVALEAYGGTVSCIAPEVFLMLHFVTRLLEIVAGIRAYQHNKD